MASKTEAIDMIPKMSTHDVIEVTEPPYFRIMKVPSGYLYNFYDVTVDEYTDQWIFVPQLIENQNP